MIALNATLRRSPWPLALMALIFALSAQPDLGTDLGVIDLIGRKIAHAGVYAALTLLWWWALVPLSAHPRRLAGGQARFLTLIAAASISFLYAAGDEFHQSFVEGRVGSPIDVGIDTVGIVIACRLIATGHAARLFREIQRRLSALRR